MFAKLFFLDNIARSIHGHAEEGKLTKNNTTLYQSLAIDSSGRTGQTEEQNSPVNAGRQKSRNMAKAAT